MAAPKEPLSIKTIFTKNLDGSPSIADRVNLLASTELTDVTDISEAVRTTDFNNTSNNIFIEIIKNYQNLSNPTHIKNFCANFALILQQANLHSKINDLVDRIVNAQIFRTPSKLSTTFGSTMSEKNIFGLIKNIFININDLNARDKLVQDMDKDFLFKFIISTKKDGKEIDLFCCREILNLNNDDLNNKISQEIKTAVSKTDNSCALIIDTLMGVGVKPGIISSIIGKLNDKTFGEMLTKLKPDLDKYIDKFPEDVKERIMNYKDGKEFKDVYKSLSPEKQAKILAGIKSDEKLKEMLDITEKKDEVFKVFDNPSVQNIKTRIDKITNNVKDIKGDYKTIRKNIWSNRFAKVDKFNNKVAAKLLEFRVELREKWLTKLGNLHTSEDRLGVIGRAQLMVYMRSAEKYKKLNERLDKRRSNIATIDKNVEKRIEENIRKKQDIVDKKAEMKENSKAAQVRMINKANVARMKQIIAKDQPKKVAKVAKANIDKRQEQMAWSLLLDSGTSLKGMKLEDITRIITNGKGMIGTLDGEQLSAFARQIQTALNSLRKSIGGDEAKLREKAQEYAGMHMGMSNYVLILAITAITITGLIILLTMILS